MKPATIIGISYSDAVETLVVVVEVIVGDCGREGSVLRMCVCGLLSDVRMKECTVVSERVYMLCTYVWSVSCLFYVRDRIKTCVSMFILDLG